MIVLNDFIMFLKNPSIEKQFDIKSLSLFLSWFGNHSLFFWQMTLS